MSQIIIGDPVDQTPQAGVDRRAFDDFQHGRFAVWAMRGPDIVSCDHVLDPPIRTGPRTLDVFASRDDVARLCKSLAGARVPLISLVDPPRTR